ncbi:MAG: TonB-dependent receptor [Bacteroidia bacterium]|nr:TonB-dependent receptor [Bacteroidia bacterium]
MIRAILITLLLLAGLAVRGQNDSLRWMKAVDIRARRFDFAGPAMRVEKQDTTAAARLSGFTLADRLNRESSLFVKSYGPGSLATLSLRGSGAAHTALLWNGISLNSGMNGLCDFSLLPVFLLGDVSVQYGGNGPLVGNAAVGGAIFLDSRPGFSKGWTAEALTSLGSFGQHQEGLGFTRSNGKVVTRTKIYRQLSDNDFSFRSPEGLARRQQHARFRQHGISQDLSIGHAAGRFDLHAWYLQNDREIPPHMLSLLSEQEQEDRSFRLSASWSVMQQRFFWNLRGGLNDEYIRYKDPAAQLDEKSRALSLQADAELGYVFHHRFRMIAQLAWLEATAVTDAYSQTRRQQQLSLGGKGLYESERLYMSLSVRQGLFDGRLIQFLPAFSMRYQILPALSLRADGSSVYRLPTLNDRYWIPGGNPDLKPEQGYTASAGLGWKQEGKEWLLSSQAGLFYSRLKKAMVWLPGSNGVYTAANIHETESRGIEGSVEVSYGSGLWRWSISFIPAVQQSVILASDPSFESAIGKQMIYTPRILYKGHCSIAYKIFSLRYYHQYTGYRYTTMDHAYFLEPFDLAELVFSWSGSLQHSRLTATFSIRNLYNTDYQVIAWRAMPGRSFLGGLMYTFGK